ncbi:MAG: acyl-CoA dehydrogenase family protein [Myxococcota bacterium]
MKNPPDSDAAVLASHMERARALAPVIYGEARAGEDAGALTGKCVEALRASGLLRAGLPREIGGDALPAGALAQIIEEISRQDGSAGWVFGMNGFITGFCAAALPEAGIDAVFSSRAPGETWIAGGFPPQGRADREGEGWRVNAHCRFGSGAHHADFMCCTVVEFDGDTPVTDHGLPRMRSFVVPRADLRFVDNWDVAGLQATGSIDYLVENLWIEDARTFVASAPEIQRGHVTFDLPLLALAGAPHAAFVLGIAQRALEEFAALSHSRQRLASQDVLAARGAIQLGFARATTSLRAARGLVLSSLDQLAEACRSDAGHTVADRTGTTAATIHAYEAALEATTFAYRSAGTAALPRDHVLQRCFRDIQAASQHIVANDEGWERLGQVWLGVTESGGF